MSELVESSPLARPLTPSEKRLRPCPFCGRPAFFVFCNPYQGCDESALYVRCSEVVECQGRTTAIYMCGKPTKRERGGCETRLIEAWNRRVTS